MKAKSRLGTGSKKNKRVVEKRKLKKRAELRKILDPPKKSMIPSNFIFGSTQRIETIASDVAGITKAGPVQINKNLERLNIIIKRWKK